MTLRTLLFAALVMLTVQAFAQQPYGYQVMDKKPQSRKLYTQGLELHDGKLYVSSGGYGKSLLLRFNFEDGSLDAQYRLPPQLFAEGLTVMGDRVYQLTWHAQRLIIYDREKLQPIETWEIPGQGWGLTNDGTQLIYGDGTDKLFYLDPASGELQRTLRVTEQGEPVQRLNELEWIDGEIWANVWQTDRILIINPTDGQVRDSIDLQGLLPANEQRNDINAVLNGIARDPRDGAIWVTGKRWPWLYRIELMKNTPTATTR